MSKKITVSSDKKFYASKTFWLGILQLAIGIAMGIEGTLGAGGVLTVAGVLTIVLRAVTNTEIKWK